MTDLSDDPDSKSSIRVGEWIVIIGSVLVVTLAVVMGTIIYQKPPPVVRTYIESAASIEGELIFRRENCFSCHEVFSNGASYGPSLDGVGSKRTGDWLQAYMRNPRPGVSVKPYRLRMPSYQYLGEEKIDVLVSYLQGLRTLDENGNLVSPAEE